MRFLIGLAVVATLGRSAAAASAQYAWLDESVPGSWNEPGVPVPAAPPVDEPIDPRCRELARPPELAEDAHVVDSGWDLIGGYQGGWDTVVITGTATYGGMCRPWHYQAFVFVKGVFSGTLSPETMDSRTDGALRHVFIEGDGRLMAEYVRYADSDPLCCPSRTTNVEFEIVATDDGPIVRPVSAFTSTGRD